MSPIREKGHAHFYPVTSREREHGNTKTPKHENFSCGACDKSTNGRVLCDIIRPLDSARISWCVCSCERAEPTVIVKNPHGRKIMQAPTAIAFHSADDWPPDIAKLYDEGAKSYAAGAYTATSMVCRKVLMTCACQEGATDGLAFAPYVDYITDTVLTYPKAKSSIDAIRQIGNDANHKIQFVKHDDAKRAMQIVTYMLNAIYSLPIA